jgi:hypothetical protein
MTDEDASKPWQRHTAQFMSRVIAVGATTFEFLHDHLDTLPQPPLAVQLSDRAALKYQLALLVIGALRTAREIAFSSSKLWLQGPFLLASVGIRMLIELNGQLLWAEEKVLAPLDAGTFDAPFERMTKLLRGSKSAVPLMRGEVGPHPLVTSWILSAAPRQPDPAQSVTTNSCAIAPIPATSCRAGCCSPDRTTTIGPMRPLPTR